MKPDTRPVTCCSPDCMMESIIAHSEISEPWDGQWYCAEHRGQTQFIAKGLLTIQQEADLDQAAAAWATDMCEKGLIGYPELERAAEIIGQAMLGSCTEQIKEIQIYRRSASDSAKRLTEIVDQGAVLAAHLQRQTAQIDSAVTALDFITKKMCGCPLDKDDNEVHSEGCFKKVAADAMRDIIIIQEAINDA